MKTTQSSRTSVTPRIKKTSEKSYSSSDTYNPVAYTDEPRRSPSKHVHPPEVGKKIPVTNLWKTSVPHQQGTHARTIRPESVATSDLYGREDKKELIKAQKQAEQKTRRELLNQRNHYETKIKLLQKELEEYKQLTVALSREASANQKKSSLQQAQRYKTYRGTVESLSNSSVKHRREPTAAKPVTNFHHMERSKMNRVHDDINKLRAELLEKENEIKELKKINNEVSTELARNRIELRKRVDKDKAVTTCLQEKEKEVVKLKDEISRYKKELDIIKAQKNKEAKVNIKKTVLPMENKSVDTQRAMCSRTEKTKAIMKVEQATQTELTKQKETEIDGLKATLPKMVRQNEHDLNQMKAELVLKRKELEHLKMKEKAYEQLMNDYENLKAEMATIRAKTAKDNEKEIEEIKKALLKEKEKEIEKVKAELNKQWKIEMDKLTKGKQIEIDRLLKEMRGKTMVECKELNEQLRAQIVKEKEEEIGKLRAELLRENEGKLNEMMAELALKTKELEQSKMKEKLRSSRDTHTELMHEGKKQMNAIRTNVEKESENQMEGVRAGVLKGSPSQVSSSVIYRECDDIPTTKHNRLDTWTQSLSHHVCGLSNLGNTCYMNAALQCIYGTIAFKDAFMKGQVCGQLPTELKNLMREMSDESKKIVRPLELKLLMQQISHGFNGSSQQDSQEFLTFLLENLHEQLLYSEDKKSLVSGVFHGQLQTTLNCGKCHQVTIKSDPFMFLSVSIPAGISQGKKADISLIDCLQMFTKEEFFEDDTWFCTKCNKHANLRRKIGVSIPPQVLIVYLKRYRQDYDGQQRKITAKVYFPRDLDLAPFMVSGKNAMYSLFAVINHSGIISSGHYTAFCKHGTQWYRFDDAQVTTLNENEIVTPNAYVLFYSCCNNSF